MLTPNRRNPLPYSVLAQAVLPLLAIALSSCSDDAGGPQVVRETGYLSCNLSGPSCGAGEALCELAGGETACAALPADCAATDASCDCLGEALCGTAACSVSGELVTCGTGDEGYDACAGKTCGESCTACDPADAECVETAVEKACDPDGNCVAETPDLCSDPGGDDYDPCEGKACGESCTLCDPTDLDCDETAVVKACDASGTCVAETPDLCPPEDGLGCANGGPACGAGLMCCSGVPYATEGECLAECLLDSDRTIKQAGESVDPDHVLQQLARLPVTKWSYTRAPGVRHIGPMAQDFHQAFAVGPDDRHIHPVDANGVTIAAIQALYRRVQALEQDNHRLRRQLAKD